MAIVLVMTLTIQLSNSIACISSNILEQEANAQEPQRTSKLIEKYFLD